ncbi:hypothetical protein, partial [Pseudomonas poae]|uniref:hypothetical protein n=1 Tax=Pseudomonas poae TaxID=200451 RepID=UPI0034D5A594
TGVRSKRVSKQICLDVQIGDTSVLMNFLVVKGLNLDFIMGCDFLGNSKAKIDFENKLINLKVNNVEISTKFISRLKESCVYN